MPEDWDDRLREINGARNHSHDILPTTTSSSTYKPDRSPYEESRARRWDHASDVVDIPGNSRERTRYRDYPRDGSETRYQTALPERPSFASNAYGGSRSSQATYESDALAGRSSHTTYETGIVDQSSQSTAEALEGAKSQYAQRNQLESRFLALELSAARRRRNDTACHTINRPTVIPGGHPPRPAGFPSQVASRSRAIIEDDTGRRAGSRVVVEDDYYRRAGSRYMVEDDVDRRAGSRYVVEDVPYRRAESHFVAEERPDRRQGSQFVVKERPERVPYYNRHDPSYEREREYVPYPQRRSSMERFAPPEVDRTAHPRRYVVLRDGEGQYVGLDR